MESYILPMLLSSLVLLCCVFVTQLAGRLGIPSLLLFLGVGIFFGQEGIIAQPSAQSVHALGVIALALILFSGGLDTEWKKVKGVALPGFSLATIGIVITAGIVGFAAHYVFELPIMHALLIGAIVSSTDAAAIFALFRARKIELKGRLGTLLEMESGSNDPVAVFLTTMMIGVIQKGQSLSFTVIPELIADLGLGIVGGVTFALLGRVLFGKFKLQFDGLYPVVTTSLALGSFAATESLHGNGFLAVYLCGVLLGSRPFVNRVSLIQFHEGLAWLSQITMFVVLGLLVNPKLLTTEWQDASLLALVLMFIARPIAVFLSLALSKFSWKERLFLAWGGLRGAVPIVLAATPLAVGLSGAEEIFHVVFFIVALSVLLQGMTIEWSARKLGLLEEGLEYVGERNHSAKLTEVKIRPNSAALGKRVVDLSLPENALIVLIERQKNSFVPRGGTIVEEGDTLLVHCPDHAALEATFGSVAV